MSTSYTIGKYVRVHYTIEDASGALVDPTAVVIKVRKPKTAGHLTGELFTYTPTRESLGVYFYDILATAPGTWCYRWESSGNITDALEGKFDVAQHIARFEGDLSDPDSEIPPVAAVDTTARTAAAAAQTTADGAVSAPRVHGGTFYAGLYGAVGDGQKLQDGAITSGTTAFTSAGSSFTSAAVGKAISIRGAGAAGAPLTTTIAAVVSPTAVTLSTTASTTVTAAHFAWGTDDSAAIQSAIDAASAAGGGRVRFAGKTYYVSTYSIPKDGVSLVGVQAATTMPTATDIANEFWDLNAQRKYQWANRGGTVFVGPADVTAFWATNHNRYLTGCTFDRLAHDGLRTLIRFGQRDDYGAANCRLVSCNGVNSTGYTLDICNSQLLVLDHCYSIYSAGFLHFSSMFSGAGYARSAGNSTFIECFGAQGPLGDAMHGIWIDADGGVIDALTFVRPQVNRLQVTPNSNTVACMRIQGRNNTDSIVQFVRLIDPDFEGFASYLLDVTNATGSFMEFFKMAPQPTNTADIRLTSSLAHPLGGNVIVSGYQAKIEYDGYGGNYLYGIAKTFTSQPMDGNYNHVDGGVYRQNGPLLVGGAVTASGDVATSTDVVVANNRAYRMKDSDGTARRLLFINNANSTFFGDVDNVLGTGTGTVVAGYDNVILKVNAAAKLELYGTYSQFTGQCYFNGYPKLKSFTVSGLGSASSDGAGAMKYATDLASATHGATATGGGSLKAVVVSDGTNWIVQ